MTEADPDEILRRMEDVYAHLQTYQDLGCVKTVFYPGTPKERINLRPFKTFFQRPSLFRFEFTHRFSADSPERRHAIWCDGRSVYERWPEQEPKRTKTTPKSIMEKLGLAIARATGISGASAHTISSLLMKEVGGYTVTDCSAAVVIGETTIGEEGCWILELQGHRSENAYISQERYVLRQISQDKIIKAGSQEQELRKGRFKSLPGLLTWLAVRKASQNVKDDLHVASETVYDNVILNGHIKSEIFINAEI